MVAPNVTAPTTLGETPIRAVMMRYSHSSPLELKSPRGRSQTQDLAGKESRGRLWRHPTTRDVNALPSVTRTLRVSRAWG